MIHAPRPCPAAGARSIAALLVALAACGGYDVHPVIMEDGTYGLSPGASFVPLDEARLLATTARLDRANGTLLLTLPDGAQQTLAVTFRPRSGWARDCRTMGGYALEEVADLSPAPLVVEGHAFQTPLIYAMCWHGRIILADHHHGQDVQVETPSVILDLQPAAP